MESPYSWRLRELQQQVKEIVELVGIVVEEMWVVVVVLVDFLVALLVVVLIVLDRRARLLSLVMLQWEKEVQDWVGYL